jgi:hypothetical protein
MSLTPHQEKGRWRLPESVLPPVFHEQAAKISEL